MKKQILALTMLAVVNPSFASKLTPSQNVSNLNSIRASNSWQQKFTNIDQWRARSILDLGKKNQSANDQNLSNSTLKSNSDVRQNMGGANGGGGHGTICGKEVKLLDHLQTKTQWTDIQLDLGKPGATVDVVLDHVLNRLEKINPNRANLYRKKIIEMLDPKNFRRFGNTHTNDSTGLLIPSGCSGDYTIAWQQAPQFVGDREFNFNLDLVEKMSDGRDLAGLFLHEAIEWEFLNRLSEYSESSLDISRLTISRSTISPSTIGGDIRPGGAGDVSSMSTLVRRVAHFNTVISSVKMNGISLQDYIPEVLKSKLFTNFDVQYGIPAWVRYYRIPKQIDWLNFYTPNVLRRIEFAATGDELVTIPFDGRQIQVSIPFVNDGITGWVEDFISNEECRHSYEFTKKDGTPCFFSLPASANTGETFNWGTVSLESAFDNDQITFVQNPSKNEIYISTLMSYYIIDRLNETATISVTDSNNKKTTCRTDGKTRNYAIVNLTTKEVSCAYAVH